MERETIFLLFLTVVGLAIGLGIVAARLRQPVVMGYLLAGLVIGRILERFGHVDPEIVQAFADFGVTFLMFSLGVHFSFRELLELRRTVLRGGFLQLGSTFVVAFLLYRAIGLDTAQAIVLAELSAISSSVIGFTLMELRGTLAQPAARPTAAILLAQDIAVVPLVALVPALAGNGTTETLLSVGRSLAMALGALATIALLGIRVVPAVLFQVARIGSRELFLLSVVFFAIGTAVGSEWAGLSFALGAFLAGIVVSESEFSYQVLGGVLPLRDVFGVIFFAGLGLLADPTGLLEAWPLAGTILVTVTIVKGFLAAVVVTSLGYPPAVALRAGAFLAQIGEFSFVLGLLALQVGIIDAHIYNAMIGAAIGSLLLNTLLLTLTERVRWLLEPPLRLFARPPALQNAQRPASTPLRGHVVIAGYGRAGREVGRVLQRRRFRFVVIDRDPVLVRELRRLGIEAIYGDVANEQVLLAANIPTARVFVVAIPDAFAAETAVRLARAMNPTLDIIARADRRAFVARLVEAGATEVVHPSFEAGLEMVRHTLHRFGMSMQEIQAIVAARRVDYYEEQAGIGE
ncbi:MAG: cation:proton antiporter [Thermomicrobium sp.]|nr:cation:proton antiporter [Thermomicrobium sp.]MDW8059048.1 cation:proton antiporter [Thermomicrobium sp.]